MKALLLFAVGLSLASSGFARDSTWLICSSDSLVVSSHEHRAQDGDGRETSFTLIFGMHELHGMLKDADSGRVRFKAANEKRTEFVGRLSLDGNAAKLSLSGALLIDGEPNEIDATLECREMSVEL